MLRLTIGLLFTLAIFSTVFAQHQAPIRCTLPNEEYHCGSICDGQATCSTMRQPCPVENTRCIDGCYCKEGYVRMDETGRCIPKLQCPMA